MYQEPRTYLPSQVRSRQSLFWQVIGLKNTSQVKSERATSYRLHLTNRQKNSYASCQSLANEMTSIDPLR
jgi:hypothetical protein